MADTGGGMPPRWRFSPEINLGHIIQAMTVVVMITGATLATYVSLRTDIQDGRARAAVEMAELNARLLKQMADISLRVLALEVKDTSDQADRIDMKHKIERLIDIVADLRVQLGKRAATGAPEPATP